MSRLSNASAELYLLISVIFAAVIAGILSWVPVFGTAAFRPIFLALVAVDVLTYGAMKFGLIKAPGNRNGSE